MTPAERAVRCGGASLLLSMVLAACNLVASPSASVRPPASPIPSVPAITPTGAPSAAATATPQPTLSLDPPGEQDPRRVAVLVAPALTQAGGMLKVTVTNMSGARIDEIVLRWPTALADTIFLAPFAPSQERVREGGDPLTASTHWTKWVEGPGERGEPAGTTSLGYGPMDAGMTLEIPLWVTRRADGPVAFDLQVLAGEALLTTVDGQPAEVRVSAP